MVLGDKRLSSDIVQEKGWKQLTNTDELETICKKILSQNPKQVFLSIIKFFSFYFILF
jgi:Asp-tRNA(Asn)/Glu-tRNA(Gln) amidotransferase B subunit